MCVCQAELRKGPVKLLRLNTLRAAPDSPLHLLAAWDGPLQADKVWSLIRNI